MASCCTDCVFPHRRTTSTCRCHWSDEEEGEDEEKTFRCHWSDEEEDEEKELEEKKERENGWDIRARGQHEHYPAVYSAVRGGRGGTATAEVRHLR